ncbi:MAG: hypothetical protein HZB51_13945 [Chloroflexi bacterium]|nr:hypothetical protein [Chloroflexota bacterium]
MNDFAELNQAVDSFCQFVESLPQKELTRKTWGPKSILAHLVYYHELYTKQAQACLDRKPIKLYDGTYRDLNAQIAERWRDVPIEKLVRRFKSANRRLGKIYATHDPRLVLVPIKQGVKPYPLAKLVPEVAAHVRNHQRQMKKELRV